MLPPGLGFNAVSEKALAAGQDREACPSYWDWQDMLKANQSGFFPYTPATNLLYGLREALRMLQEEGLENVFRRHERHGEATRAAVRAWGLEIVCEDPAGVFELSDGGLHARGSQRRPTAGGHSRALRHVARHGPASWPERCSASATWAASTT